MFPSRVFFPSSRAGPPSASWRAWSKQPPAVASQPRASQEMLSAEPRKPAAGGRGEEDFSAPLRQAPALRGAQEEEEKGRAAGSPPRFGVRVCRAFAPRPPSGLADANVLAGPDKITKAARKRAPRGQGRCPHQVRAEHRQELLGTRAPRWYLLVAVSTPHLCKTFMTTARKQTNE